MSFTCDRCGRVMNDRWEIGGMPGVGGNGYAGSNLASAVGGCAPAFCVR
jgi:hypothetical protein